MSNWTIEIQHPSTDRWITPQLLDDPQFEPNPNGQPELTIPVERSTDWLHDEWDNASVRAYESGTRVPVEQLTEQRLREGRTELIAQGGIELTVTEPVEIEQAFSHTAFENVVTEHTNYQTDIDAPDADLQEDVTLRDIDNTESLEDVFGGDIADTDPIQIGQNGLELLRTGMVREGENYDDGVAQRTVSDDAYSGGEAAGLISTADDIAFGLSADYPIGEYDIYIRADVTENPDDSSGIHNGFEVNIDGTTVATIPADAMAPGFGWSAPGPLSGIGPTVEIDDVTHDVTLDGSFELEFDVHEDSAGHPDLSSEDEDLVIDMVAVLDTDHPHDFDETVHEPGGYLDAPKEYPKSATVQSETITSPFSIDTVYFNADIDDTSNNQSLGVSNDGGQNWHTYDNTDSLSHQFSEATTSINVRVTLSQWSPNGPRDATPRIGYDTQTVSSGVVSADLDQSPIVVDFSDEQDILSTLNGIVGQSFVWEFAYDSNEDPIVRLTQPGRREAIGTTDVVELTIRKHTDTYESVTVRGANRRTDGERFTSSDVFTALNRQFIVPGTETVHDGEGVIFNRGTDYEIGWRDGEIRRTTDSNLTASVEYQIDYDFEIRGTYTLDGVSDPSERIVDIPGVVSTEGAEVIAKQFVDRLSAPRWSAEALIPPRESVFSAIEALDFALRDSDLPESALPMVPGEEPEHTNQGLRLGLDSDVPFSEVIRDVRDQTNSISRRV